MRPLFHPHLVNGPFEDPGLYVDCQFERRALLFDLGDIRRLSSREIMRVSHVFVTHAHLDHFIGFFEFVRVNLFREKTLQLFGPPNFIERVEAALSAFTWDAIGDRDVDLIFRVSEISKISEMRTCEFRLRDRFSRGKETYCKVANGIIYQQSDFHVRATLLQHHSICCAYAIEEQQHVNFHKNKIVEKGYRVGPWLTELRQAILRGDPDNTLFRVYWEQEGREHEDWCPLSKLKQELLHIEPGQKIAYVVDAVFSEVNAKNITTLVRNADVLFVETAFLQKDATIAARKKHLTASQAGTLARQAGVRRIVPLHFSTRYETEADELVREVQEAFDDTAQNP
jgi:ribonuclease Z